MLALIGAGRPAFAQYIETYLQPAVPGFDEAQGVTVLSRLRPLYADQGVRLGSIKLTGGLDERFGYDSNITGTSNGPGSAYFETNPTVSAQSDWARNRLGIAATMDDYEYLSAPRQSHTDYTVALGGGYTILRNTLDVGYSHLHGNEFGTDAGAIAYDTPVPFDVDIIRSAYTLDFGRLRFTPNVDFRLYQYGSTTFQGQPVPQLYRDRTVLTGGVTTSYDFSDQRALVLVVQGTSSHYIHPQPGALSNNSQSLQILPGLVYQATGPWRYRLLIGGEFRSFDASQYGSRLSPIAEASVIYTPTGLTTITATLRSDVEDTSSEGSSGFTSTGFNVVVDHELRRNVLLQATGSFDYVSYYQGLGSSTSFGFGGGATWLIDNHLSAFANYRFAHQDGSAPRSLLNTTTNSLSVLSSFTQNLALIGLRWKL